MTRLTEHIKTKTNATEPGQQYSVYFPSFVLLLRDFFLDIQVDGKASSPDQYMEAALKTKPGMNSVVYIIMYALYLNRYNDTHLI